MTIRSALSAGLLLAATALTAACQVQSTDQPAPVETELSRQVMTVYHDPTCGCCGLWVDHMRENGFVVDIVPTRDMNAVKLDLGVPRDLPSCHTAVVGDYVIEGHVPAEDVSRLLAEQPEAFGLAVPGMPLGSPGMESNGRRMPYDVILFGADGTRSEFNHYGALDPK